MAICIFALRKHHLHSLIFRYQQKLLDITKRISDMQQYASSIGDGSVSIYDMADMPSSMFQRGMAYMMNSHNMAVQQAQMNFNQMQPMIQQQMGMMDPQSQQGYMAWVQNKLYDQARERFAKVESKRLNAQEKQLTLEKEKIESALKMAEQELESVKKAEDDGIKMIKPNYTGNG